MSVLSWMAMMFYLPRLFVYHAENRENKGFCEVVKIQEFKLYRYIGNPAMMATVASGIAMIALNSSILSEGWLHAKLFFLLLLLGYHHECGRYVKMFNNDGCLKSGKFFRYFNEIPTILMIGIVIFVVVKPF